MLLTEMQVTNIRRVGLVLGLLVALFYLFGWVVSNIVAREIILFTFAATVLTLALATDFIAQQPTGRK